MSAPLCARVPAFPRLRRTTAVVLLVLQSLVAFASVVELNSPIRPVAHADADGSRHISAHDESTCVLCAIRTSVADATRATGALVAVETSSERVNGDVAEISPLQRAHDNPSRAPPAVA